MHTCYALCVASAMALCRGTWLIKPCPCSLLLPIFSSVVALVCTLGVLVCGQRCVEGQGYKILPMLPSSPHLRQRHGACAHTWCAPHVASAVGLCRGAGLIKPCPCRLLLPIFSSAATLVCTLGVFLVWPVLWCCVKRKG